MHSHVTRRRALQALVAFVATGGCALAQSQARVRRIAFLGPYQEPMAWIAPLRELGWVEGRNLEIERRITNGFEGLPSAARELAAPGVDVIVTDGTDATRAAKAATARIPIVMAAVGDPVATGIVASLAHPGGNITGYSILSAEIAVKRAQLVRELLPSAQRVVVVMSSRNAMYPLLRAGADEAYRALGLQPRFVDAPSAEQLAVALADPDLRLEAVVIGGDITGADAATVMRALTPLRVPVIAGSRPLLDAGALIAFDVDRRDQERRVAAIIDKILRGAAPASIPVEQPTSFVLVVNLKAAKAIGVAVPQSLVLRADEVVQ
jgi:putative ABC transport system substrate-binding protein